MATNLSRRLVNNKDDATGIIRHDARALWRVNVDDRRWHVTTTNELYLYYFWRLSNALDMMFAAASIYELSPVAAPMPKWRALSSTSGYLLSVAAVIPYDWTLVENGGEP